MLTTNIIKVRGVSKGPDSGYVDVLSLEAPYLFSNLIKSGVTPMDAIVTAATWVKKF